MRPRGVKNPTGSSAIAFAPFGAGLSVARYWSNVDNGCEPRFFMNRTLVSRSGNPVIRFTGQTHNLTLPITVAAADANLLIDQLRVLVDTGRDNLNGGNSATDNATALLLLLNGTTLTFPNINAGREWGSLDTHTANLSVPGGLRVRDLASLTIRTGFNGGDNWDVTRVALMAAVRPGPALRPAHSVHCVSISQPARTTQ